MAYMSPAATLPAAPVPAPAPVLPLKPAAEKAERKRCENCGHPPSATGRKHVPHSNRCEQTKRRGGASGLLFICFPCRNRVRTPLGFASLDYPPAPGRPQKCTHSFLSHLLLLDRQGGKRSGPNAPQTRPTAATPPPRSHLGQARSALSAPNAGTNLRKLAGSTFPAPTSASAKAGRWAGVAARRRLAAAPVPGWASSWRQRLQRRRPLVASAGPMLHRFPYPRQRKRNQ